VTTSREQARQLAAALIEAAEGGADHQLTNSTPDSES